MGKAIRPYNGLANRRLQPLGHLTVKIFLAISAIRQWPIRSCSWLCSSSPNLRSSVHFEGGPAVIASLIHDPADVGVSDSPAIVNSIRGRARPVGLTAPTASSSVDRRCRDVTVTHSPTFTVLIADNALSGSFTRIVMY